MDVFVNYSDKISTGLQLSLETETGERAYTILLRYSGNYNELHTQTDILMIPLLNQFAIGSASKEQIQVLAYLPQILYIDLTRQMEYEQAVSTKTRIASCFPMYDTSGQVLRGNGIVCGIVDSGVDINHPAFRKKDGKSRIVTYWDQMQSGNAPAPYAFGAVYTYNQINDFIRNGQNIPRFDISGHGTSVASIISALSPEAELAVVAAMPDTAAFLCAIDYLVRYAADRRQPLVLNLSYGNNYGDHAGNSLIEQYINTLRANGKITIVTGTGNEGNTGRHRYIHGSKAQSVGIALEDGLSVFNLQFWSDPVNPYQFQVRSPSGETTIFMHSDNQGQFYSYQFRSVNISIQIGSPSPYNQKQEIFFSFHAASEAIQSGYWSIEIRPFLSNYYAIDAWLPVAASTSADIEFEIPTPDLSLTIPATADIAISVAAYDPSLQSIAVFSGKGSTTIQKPDFAAPGVNILTARSGGGYVLQTGTSFSAPFVSAAAANLMQWGITDGNDPFLYGDRMKAYLKNGAIPLPGDSKIPNISEGWGRLCANASIPHKSTSL